MRRLLFLTTDVPWPADAGGKIKTWNMLKFLSAHFRIDLVCLSSAFDHDAISELQTSLSGLVAHVFDVRRPRNFFSLVGALRQGKAINEYRVYDTKIEEFCTGIATRCDVILADHFETWQYVPVTFLPRTLLHAHNAEFVLWQRYAMHSKSWIGFAAAFESRRMRRRELGYVETAAAAMAAPADIARWRKAGLQSKNVFPTLHLGHEEWLALPAPVIENAPPSVLFFGTLSWKPNEDALFYFLDEIWPLILKKYPETHFTVAGGGGTDALQQKLLQTSGVEYLGYVADLLPLFLGARCVAVPLRYGSGIKVKILDALYRGLPVVSTSVGVESLSLESGLHYLKGESPVEFANACCLLLTDSAKATEIAVSGRAYAQSHLRWQPVLEDILSHLNGLTDKVVKETK
jgi:glycosyltransferase involved in cell wall biosynthesis